MEKTPGACWGFSVLVSMVLLAGCGGSGTKDDKGTGGAAGRAAAEDGGVSTGGGGKAGSSGMAGANAGSSGSSGSTGMCYVDSPCGNAFRCVSNNSYQAQTTNWDCHSLCGPGPCSGGTCQSSGSPIACPAGTQCVAPGGFDAVAQGCRPIPDAGAGDSRLMDRADAPASEVASVDAQTADRAVKSPLDALKTDTSTRLPVDAVAPDVVRICVPGERRCEGSDPVLQTCAASGTWWDSRGCDYACRDGACVGECEPGVRRRCRATSNSPQTCDSTSSWVDEPACSGSTPYCATGQCVAACLNEGQDCSASTTACCAGTECIASNGNTDIMIGSGTFVCKAIPACVASGAACAANTDCCAGLDCTAGKCAAKQTNCLDAPADGVCGGTSGATCCPGTECSRQYNNDPLGCRIPTTSRGQEIACPREQPAFHESCRAAMFGLACVYSDWSKANGVFYTCTCSYHGWSCTVGHYVH